MGTRLYPQTSDTSVIERLINVPKGTYARLEQLRIAFDAAFKREGDDCIGDIDSGIDAQHMLVSATNGEYFSNHMSPKEAVELANGLCWS